MAAKGPKQSEKDKVPHPVPEIMHEDSGAHTSDNPLSQKIKSAPSHATQQEQAEERASEARDDALRVADESSEQGKEFAAKAQSELERLEKQAGQTYDEMSAEAKQDFAQWKKQAQKEYASVKKEVQQDGRKARDQAQKAGKWTEENKGNPVVIGNAVAITALAGLLSAGAYNMHQKGTLTWKVAGAWAGVVGLFAVGDYYVSQ